MKPNKILLLEAPWPQASGSTSMLYHNFMRGRSVQLHALPLCKTDYITAIRSFLQQPENRYGPNMIILSGHGHYDPDKGVSTLSAQQGLIDIKQDMALLRSELRRSVVVLDACNLGRDLLAIREALQCFGLVGFGSSANWVASSAFVMALLQRYCDDKVLTMQRIRSVRPRKVLRQMAAGSYAELMAQLEVSFIF